MDPNTTLARLHALIVRLALPEDEEASADWAETHWDELVEFLHLFIDLDQWMRNGGFHPAAWAQRGVNLDMGETGEKLYAAIDRVRDLLRNKHVVLPSRNPTLVVAKPLVGDAGSGIVACLGVHVANATSPVEAVDLIRASLEATLKEIGDA